jgi:hypothetical protein
MSHTERRGRTCSARGLGAVELLQQHGVALEVRALADDRAFDAEVAQGLEPLLGPELGLLEVEVLDLALVAEVDAGDVDVDVAERPRPELAGRFAQDALEIQVGIDRATFFR